MTDAYGFQYFATTRMDHGILEVAFNRPERRNAISPEMHAEIAPLFRRIGADFSGMQANLDSGYEDGFPDLMVGSAEVVRAQLGVPQPVVVAINGDAIGLGATIGRYRDIVYMADEARIADPHVRAGLVAGDGGAILWPLLLGPHRGEGVPPDR